MVTPVETLTGMIPTVVAARLVHGAATVGTRRRRTTTRRKPTNRVRKLKPRITRVPKRKTARRRR